MGIFRGSINIKAPCWAFKDQEEGSRAFCSARGDWVIEDSSHSLGIDHL